MVAELGEVVFEVPDGIKEIARTPVDRVVHRQCVGQVVTVGIEHEHDGFYLADIHQSYDIFRQGSSIADVLYP